MYTFILKIIFLGSVQSPVACEKLHSSEVKTPDFEAQFLEIESPNLPFKSSAFSRKGHEVSRTSAPASLFNSPEQLPYTQGLEETIVQKYSAVKEVFNNLSGDETESALQTLLTSFQPAPAMERISSRSNEHVPFSKPSNSEMPAFESAHTLHPELLCWNGPCSHSH